MKIAFAASAALLLAGIAGSAQAQGVPRGSYLQSCSGIHMRGDTLVATCRTVDGGALRTRLPSVSRCVGDIGNNNGYLQCSYAGGGPPPYRPPSYAQPPYAQPPYGEAPYGQAPYGQAPPPPGYNYGPPRY